MNDIKRALVTAEREVQEQSKTIASQRATIAKLRKELKNEIDASVTFEEMADEYRAEAETWRQAHQQLANAIGGKR